MSSLFEKLRRRDVEERGEESVELELTFPPALPPPSPLSPLRMFPQTSKVTETASKATETVAQVAGNTTGGKVAQGAEGGSKPRYVRVTYPEPALVEPEKWEGKPITEAFNRVHPVEK